MQTYEELINKPGNQVTAEELDYMCAEGRRRELKELLTDVSEQLKLELKNWGEEEAPDLVALIERVDGYIDENLEE